MFSIIYGGYVKLDKIIDIKNLLFTYDCADIAKREIR